MKQVFPIVSLLTALFLFSCGDDQLEGSYSNSGQVLKIQYLNEFDYLIRVTDSSGETRSLMGNRAGDILYGKMLDLKADNGEGTFMIKPDPAFASLEFRFQNDSTRLERTNDLRYDSLFQNFRSEINKQKSISNTVSTALE